MLMAAGFGKPLWALTNGSVRTAKAAAMAAETVIATRELCISASPSTTLFFQPGRQRRRQKCRFATVRRFIALKGDAFPENH